MPVDAHALSELPLFQGLSAVELAELDALVHRQSLPAGTLLMSSEQLGEAVYIILEGTAKIFLSREDGSEVILSILGAGRTVGEMSLLDSAGRSANVVTMEPSVVLWIDGESFRRCLRTMPMLSYNLILLLCRRLRLANEQVLALSSLDVAGRVARQILALADQYGEPGPEGATRIPLRLTQGDLAATVGTSRERVNRAMVRFKAAGTISVDERYRISIHDRSALAARCR